MRRATCLVSTVFLSGALAACGGSSSKSGTSTPAGRTTTTIGTTTVPASGARAGKAALQLADVGTAFSTYRKADGVQPIGTKSCSVTVDGAVLTPKDHYFRGAMYKKKDSGYFAYSEAYTFRDESTAKRYADFRATPAFKQCKQRQDDTATRAARPGSYVRLDSISYPDKSGHIPTMYREYTGSVSNGKRVDGGFYDRYTLRNGPVVVVVNIDSELAKDDASSNAIAQQTGAILQALETRLTAA